MNSFILHRVVRPLQSYKHRSTLQTKRRLWLDAHRQNKTAIHPSLEFAGRELPLDAAQIGPGSVIERDVTIWRSYEAEAEPTLRLGENAFIGRNTYIGLYQPITIGSNAMIGAYCYLISANHRYERRDAPIREQGYTGAPIFIEEDVWLGTHVVVLPGVTIGKGAIIAAGSIVNKNVPAYEIWGGVPAVFLKSRP